VVRSTQSRSAPRST